MFGVGGRNRTYSPFGSDLQSDATLLLRRSHLSFMFLAAHAFTRTLFVRMNCGLVELVSVLGHWIMFHD